MFTLTNPLLLWAFPVLALPWIFRRRQEERIRRVGFPLIQFLRESKEKELIDPQLQEWLLLILRTLLLAVLLLALAGPKWVTDSPQKGGFFASLPFTKALQNQTVVLDASYSMAYGQGEDSWWRRAQRVWKVIDAERSGFPIDGIRWDRTSLLAQPTGRIPLRSANEIDNLFLTPPSEDGTKLSELTAALERTLDGNESIVLITDGQRLPWTDLLESGPAPDTIPPFLAVTIGQGPATNTWCEVNLLSSPPWGIAGWETVTGQTGSIREQTENGNVSIIHTDSGEKLHAQKTAFPATPSSPALLPMVFTTRFSDLNVSTSPSGENELTFTLRVEPDDPLPLDNELTVSVPCIDAFKVAAAYDVDALSSVYPVLKSAINPLEGTPESPPVTIETIPPNRFDLNETIDLAVLSKTLAPWFAPPHISATLEYVKNGGAAIVFTEWDGSPDGVWAQFLSDLGWRWSKENVKQSQPEWIATGGSSLLSQSLAAWDETMWQPWIPSRHGTLEGERIVPLVSYRTGSETHHLIAQAALGQGRLWIVNSSLRPEANTLLSPVLPAFLWEAGKDAARMKRSYTLPRLPNRAESNLILLSDEEKQQISERFPIRFATLDTLSSELSSFSGGTDLRMLLLFGCLVLALFETWLSNRLASM